ncbi:MAG: glutaredoxin family protein [Euzebyaceae bacterium]|nr:glutaredoxin family protein [Euzebyaceae bacterium]
MGNRIRTADTAPLTTNGRRLRRRRHGRGAGLRRPALPAVRRAPPPPCAGLGTVARALRRGVRLRRRRRARRLDARRVRRVLGRRRAADGAAARRGPAAADGPEAVGALLDPRRPERGVGGPVHPDGAVQRGGAGGRRIRRRRRNPPRPRGPRRRDGLPAAHAVQLPVRDRRRGLGLVGGAHPPVGAAADRSGGDGVRGGVLDGRGRRADPVLPGPARGRRRADVRRVRRRGQAVPAARADRDGRRVRWRRRRRPAVTVYTRAGCGLCRTAERVVAHVARGVADVELVQIDTDPELVERFTLRVPVVFVDGVEFAEYEVDPIRFRDRLRAAAAAR